MNPRPLNFVKALSCIYILLMVNVNVNVNVHVDIFGLSSWIEQHWMETLWVKKVGPMS